MSSCDITPIKRKISDTNRCLGCNEDLGDRNPRQYCCKTYCPELENRRREIKKSKVIELPDPLNISTVYPNSSSYKTKSDLIIISKNGEELASFDKSFCNIKKKTLLKMVKIVMQEELLKLKIKLDSHMLYTSSSITFCNENQKLNNSEEENYLDIINIGIRTKYNLESLRYGSLKMCYDYIKDFDGICDVDDKSRCFCSENECIRCKYRNYMSINNK